jgi:uncharacterized membrane protein YagU involved in acid resistance
MIVLESLGTGAAAGVAGSATMSLFLEGLRAGGVIDREPPEIITSNMEQKAGTKVAPADDFDARWLSVHAAFGATMGGVFGMMRGVLPRNTAAAGALFGAGLWTVMYPITLPALSLYPKPDDDYEPRAWAIALGHLVYGLTVAAAFDTARYSARRRDR